MTPHERDPFVERSRATILSTGSAGITAITVNASPTNVIPASCRRRATKSGGDPRNHPLALAIRSYS